jgi:hypothetical protein
LYHELSPEKPFRLVVRALTTLFVLYGMIYPLVSIFGCSPINGAWDLNAMTTAQCIDKKRFFLAASITNVCMDLAILLLPVRIVVPLQMAVRQKMEVLLLFAVGGLVTGLATYNSVLTIRLFDSDNYTWIIADEICWMYAELALGVVCVSASSLRPFFVRYLPAIVRSGLGAATFSGSSAPPGLGQRSRKSGNGTLVTIGRIKDSQGRKGHYQNSAEDTFIELESNTSADGGETGGGAGQEYDDEAELWTGRGKGNLTAISAARQETNVPNSGERIPGTLSAAERVPRTGSRLVAETRMAPGISVVKETEVSCSRAAKGVTQGI